MHTGYGNYAVCWTKTIISKGAGGLDTRCYQVDTQDMVKQLNDHKWSLKRW